MFVFFTLLQLAVTSVFADVKFQACGKKDVKLYCLLTNMMSFIISGVSNNIRFDIIQFDNLDAQSCLTLPNPYQYYAKRRQNGEFLN